MWKSVNNHRIIKQAKHHANALMYGLGAAAISAWTLLRFFNRPSTFDLVTQQVVAKQWLHGNFGPISFGTTHYLLKLLFFYIPLDILPGSPRLKLILLTLLINIATFVLLIVVLNKILNEFGIRAKHYLAGAMLWLSMIAGSVFWIQFSNSRNLEVVGGMFMFYLSLRFLRVPTKRLALGLLLFAAVLFFSDTLQLYMTAVPLLVYAAILMTKKLPWQRWANLAAVLLVGFTGSKLLFWLAAHLLNITFTSSDSFVANYSMGQLTHAIPDALKSTLTLFSGNTDATRLREIVDLVFFGTACAAFAAGALKRLIPRRLALLILVFFVCDEAIYIASGQALAGNTERYLIMLAPVAVLAFASMRKVVPGTRLVYAAFTLFIAFNALTLGRALIINWNTNFPQDTHLQSIAAYANQHQSLTIYASMDSALPLTYYRSAPNTNFIALACTQPKLIVAQSVPAVPNASIPATALLLLDGSSIRNQPNVCTYNMIIRQFGRPLNVADTNDGSFALTYRATTLIDNTKR